MLPSDYIFFKGRVYTPESVSTPKWVGFRALLPPPFEAGKPIKIGTPCVIGSHTVPVIVVTPQMRQIAYALNPTMLKEKVDKLFDGTSLAFCNGHPGKLLDAIICHGSFYRGRVVEDDLIVTPGVGAIDVNLPLPSADKVIEKHWFFYAISLGAEHVNNFVQGGGAPVRMPYFLRTEARYPATWFVAWDSDALPDHLKAY